MGIFVYISFCMAEWFVSRGNLAYVGVQYGMQGWFINDIVAFFIGGIVPVLLYVLLSSASVRMLKIKVGGDLDSVKLGLDVAVIIANVVLFALKFIYLAVPLYAFIIEMIIDPVVMLLSVGLYMLIAFKREYVDKAKFKLVLANVMSRFITVYAVLTVLNLLMSVM